MDTITHNGIIIAIADKSIQITEIQDVLDIIVSAHYTEQSTVLVFYKESLPQRFFDLKSGYAGEMLQKFSNYRTKLAIVGDFSDIASKSLKDFMYECNKGNLVFFKNDLASAVTALTGV